MRVTSRKAAREALTGVQAGRVLSRVILKNQSADAVPKGGRQHQPVRNREHGLDSARSKTPARMETPRARTGRPCQRRHEEVSGPVGEGDEPQVQHERWWGVGQSCSTCEAPEQRREALGGGCRAETTHA